MYDFALAAGGMQSTDVSGLYIPAFGKSLSNAFLAVSVEVVLYGFHYFVRFSSSLPLLLVPSPPGVDAMDMRPGLRTRWECDGMR